MHFDNFKGLPFLFIIFPFLLLSIFKLVFGTFEHEQ